MTNATGAPEPVSLGDLGPDAAEHDGLSYAKLADAVELTRETIGQTLQRVAAAHPGRPALMWLTDAGIASMTWAELVRQSGGAATELAEQNPDRARVVLIGANSTEWIIAFYAAALAGMAVVPLGPTVTADEIVSVLGDFDVSLILVDDRAPGSWGRTESAVSTAGSAAVIRSLVGWRVARDVQLPGSPSPIPQSSRRASPDGECLVQYTSGTTGRPRGASLTHIAALNVARLFAEGTGGGVGDVWLNPLPLYHVGGLVTGLLSCLSISATYIVTERFSAPVVLRAVREARPGFIGVVPTMLIDLLEQPDVSAADFASVRTVLGGATDIDPNLVTDVEERLGIRFGVAYGQSEAPCMAMTFATDSVAVRTSTLGHLLPGRDFCLADEAGVVQPIGTAGELCVRGPLNMSGYTRADGTVNPDATDGGWRRTGDICILDAAGILRICGRSRDVIIRGGTNIYTAEVEERLSTHPAVREIAVFGLPDRRMGQRVAAAVLPAAGAVADPGELAQYAETRLSPGKRPTKWIVLDDFPRTASGKVRKHVLQQLAADVTEAGADNG